MKISFGVSVTTVYKMIIVIVITKWISIHLGPSGIAMTSIFGNFVTLSQTVATGGIGTGIIKLISEYITNKQKLKEYIHSGLFVTICATLITIIVILTFSEFITEKFLFDVKYKNIIYLSSIFIAFYSFQNLFISILNGFQNFKKIVTFNFLNSTMGLILSVTLIKYYELEGALYAIMGFQVSGFILLLYVFDIRKYLFSNSKFSITLNSVRNLASYSSFTFINAITIPSSQYTVRYFIVIFFNLQSAGYWDSMNKISFALIAIINTSMSLYLIPKITRITSYASINKEIRKSGLFFLSITFLLFITVFFFRDLLIIFLYSNKFLYVKNLFLYQLIGDFLRLFGWIFACVMLSKSMIKELIICDLLSSIIIYLPLSYFFIEKFGLIGATYAYAINYLIYLIIVIFIHYQKTKNETKN